MNKHIAILIGSVLLLSPVLGHAQEPERAGIQATLDEAQLVSPNAEYKTYWDIFWDKIAKPENPNIEFVLAPYIGYRTYKNNLSDSMSFGFTVLYPFEKNINLLAGYSYSNSFDNNDLKGIHVFDYGIYTTPLTFPKYNVSVFGSVYMSKNSYTDSSQLMIGYGIRYLFKKQINTVTYVETSLGAEHSKVGIERNVVIPKRTFDRIKLPRFEKLRNVHWAFWKKKKDTKETTK